jgi:OOP family OmpA-OmpF porin
MIRAAVLLCLLAGPVAALEIALPATARLTVERDTAPDIYEAPIGPYAEGAVPTLTIEGAVERAAWRLDSPGLTPLQVIRPLRAQLLEAGFEILLDCASKTCGGFDFRFETEVLPGPNMYVNLRAYHAITAVKGGTPAQPERVVTLLASTSATAAYVQIIQAAAVEAEAELDVEPIAPLPLSQEPHAEAGDLATQLLGRGHAVLGDLDFDSGSTDLGPGPFGSLAALADFLAERPELRLALVGHTDTVGGLAPNIDISRARAASVRQRLITEFGVDAARLDAEGMGYLAPLASNLDAGGRDTNRRVEAVILPE